MDDAHVEGALGTFAVSFRYIVYIPVSYILYRNYQIVTIPRLYTLSLLLPLTLKPKL